MSTVFVFTKILSFPAFNMLTSDKIHVVNEVAEQAMKHCHDFQKRAKDLNCLQEIFHVVYAMYNVRLKCTYIFYPDKLSFPMFLFLFYIILSNKGDQFLLFFIPNLILPALTQEKIHIFRKISYFQLVSDFSNKEQSTNNFVFLLFIPNHKINILNIIL